MTTAGSTLACAGCGTTLREAATSGSGPYPFRCPEARRGDDIDHIVTRTLNPETLEFPHGGDANPFVRYRTLLYSYHLASEHGISDHDYITLVRALDAALGRVETRAMSSGSPAGFRITPFARDAAITGRLGFTPRGGVWIKDETRNVSGSHKARHLMGIMIYLQVLERLGLVRAPLPRLAIASCGNAALAAAVVARAADRDLDVFIPPDAPGPLVARLHALGAHTVICRREPGMQGDPCYLRFQEAVEHGAIPFCCQGAANGLTIEGGETLGFEMIHALGATALDAVVIQVGGGALASAVIQSFTDAQALGACPRLPRFYTVQTRGAFPLKRAFDRAFTGKAGLQTGSDLQAWLRYARTHRHEFMWPWEDPPHSVARGILDDETYDWVAVVKGMLETGGQAVVVEEAELVAAYALAHELTEIDVDYTGAAGLAGLLQLSRSGAIAPDEKVAIVFSGAERR